MTFTADIKNVHCCCDTRTEALTPLLHCVLTSL